MDVDLTIRYDQNIFQSGYYKKLMCHLEVGQITHFNGLGRKSLALVEKIHPRTINLTIRALEGEFPIVVATIYRFP